MRPPGHRPSWIFFDCFNTLLDDFDETGDESGLLKSMVEVVCTSGPYTAQSEFLSDYAAWRKNRWSGHDWGEVLLTDRLRAVLLSRMPERADRVEGLVSEMIRRFETDFPKLVRLTPGVREMLQAWRGQARMGVVSNCFLPGWPERLLTEHGLGGYFDFVLDSAGFGSKKPGPPIYLEALRLAGLDTQDADCGVFVGDSLGSDVVGPQGLGMRAIYFDRSSDRPLPAAPQDVATFSHWDQFRPEMFVG